MRKFTSLALAAATMAAVLLPFSAEALPVTTSLPATASAPVTLVAGGCGPGMHRGPLGGCRPNGAVVLVRRPICRTVLLPLPHRVCR